MQSSEDIYTDKVYLWSPEYLDNAKPHYKVIVPFFKNKLKGRILDIGECNPLTQALSIKYGVEIDNTDGELDYDWSTEVVPNYDTIVCSHVIEHLFNPLNFLDNCYVVMTNSARLYIIAPIKPYWITPAKCHFHEMNDRTFKALIAKSCFEIEDWQRYNVPIEYSFSVRNILRRLYKEYSIVTLKKKQ